jgi:hypothetical protein
MIEIPDRSPLDKKDAKKVESERKCSDDLESGAL